MALLDEIKEVVAKQLDIKEENIEDSSKFIDDLGADSLDVVELVMALEEKFEIEIPDKDAEKIANIKDVITFIENCKA